ncbi:Major royal jelly protein [Popillia japonica]|uniref:Major royal jelly protein n=1 Tax=Popillia japonica TaxID=7064 RepID=A0AAW1HW41_POPJA
MGNKFLCLVMGFCVSGAFGATKFKKVFEFNELDFDYPTEASRQHDIDTKVFIPGVPAPIDMDVYYAPDKKHTTFVTIPRFQAGIPVTLGSVLTTSTGKNIIQPFPSWKWHRDPEHCRRDRLVSVYRIKIDNCGRLWVLDTGRHLDKKVCDMQILAFDLATNQLIHKYTIPDDLLEPRSILVTPIIDIRENCSDVFVYVADCQTFSIIVYDVMNDRAWRASDKTMYPYPNYGTYRIQGEQFDLMDGVLGMDLSPYHPGQDRKLFYHAMSSATENWALTSDLKNEDYFKHDPSAHPELFHTYKGYRQSQSAAEAIDRNGIAFFGQMTETTISCWNTATEYGPSNIDVIEYNPQTLQFASGVKVIDNPRGHQELWVLTSRFQKVATGTLSPNEVNFRIQAIRVEDAVAGTRCKAIRHQPGSGGGQSGRYKSGGGQSGRYKAGNAAGLITGGYGLAQPNEYDKLYFTK